MKWGNGVMETNLLVDSHVHSNYSDDSTLRPEEAVVKAIALGLKGLAFTDHYDLNFPDKQYLFEFDPGKRAIDLNALRQQYGPEFEILDGIEIGLQPHILEQASDVVDSHPFDFVIGSVHAVDGIALHDPDEFYENKTKEQAYRRYFEEIYQIVRSFENFDVIGHLGYIRRYGPYENKSMHLRAYDDIIDSIFTLLIQRGKGIEVNVSGYAYHLGAPIPDVDIIKRFKELGGEIITLGSDAHDSAHISKSFKQGLAAISRAGFEHICYFKNREPVFVALK
jgi:histidinol-phosphatase (PHP family)